jgi:predicted flap endonuclease-1-like 5' DNA nuclease
MNNNTNQSSCPMMCWIIAALAGLFILVLGLALWDLMLMQAIFFGAVVFIILGFLFSWLFCSGQSTAVGNSASAVDDATVETTSAPAAQVAEPVAPAPAEEKGVLIKASASLPGQQDLASRKGTWTYTADAAGNDVGGSSGGAAAVVESNDADDADDGTRPEALSAPRAGGADDLKRIKGIGLKLEKLCNEMGVYHFDQISGWNATEVAWMDANLKGFKGRVTRDEWVAQASLLASGGEPEFSKRVDKGGVY